ncbi:MAG: GNAT family N-acetyltransferase [Acutalibacter sp.]|jgi:RimJ/RimL family protein N-acetyltransferase|nr:MULTISPECIES: GNAT family N-acetyltransferase [unclassified Acutalibacter]MCI9224370.1 GNAT family N-acetyltransferase [Acutalibacter sp.]
MELRKCTIADLDRLALWSMQAQADMRQGSPWGDVEESPELLAGERETVERRLLGEDFDLYEFIENGEAVGMVTVERARKNPGVGLESFFICREHRRRGCGTRALNALMEHLGEKELDLDVFCWNSRAIAFYRSFGFKEISLHMNYGT